MAVPAECPVCRHSLRWTYLLQPMWGRWHCRHCGSLLGVNVLQRLLIIVLCVPLVVAGVRFSAHGGWSGILAVLALLAAIVPILLLLDRPRVIERAGIRCRGCGYDLRGQATPRCPECGRELDAAEQAQIASGELPVAAGPAHRRGMLLLIIAIVLLVLSVLGTGFGWFRATTLSAARRAVPAAQATSAPAETP